MWVVWNCNLHCRPESIETWRPFRPSPFLVCPFDGPISIAHFYLGSRQKVVTLFVVLLLLPLPFSLWKRATTKPTRHILRAAWLDEVNAVTHIVPARLITKKNDNDGVPFDRLIGRWLFLFLSWTPTTLFSPWPKTTRSFGSAQLGDGKLCNWQQQQQHDGVRKMLVGQQQKAIAFSPPSLGSISVGSVLFGEVDDARPTVAAVNAIRLDCKSWSGWQLPSDRWTWIPRLLLYTTKLHWENSSNATARRDSRTLRVLAPPLMSPFSTPPTSRQT